MSRINTFIYDLLSPGEVPEVVACELLEIHHEKCYLIDLMCDLGMKA